MMVAMRMLKIFCVSEDEEEWTDDRDAVTGLISDFAFEKDSHHDEKESAAGNTENPGEAMFLIAGNEGQRWGEEDNEANGDMNPSRVGIERNGRKKERKECHHYAVDDTGGGKGNSQAIPNFFHSGHIAEPQQCVYNGRKLNPAVKRS